MHKSYPIIIALCALSTAQAQETTPAAVSPAPPAASASPSFTVAPVSPPAAAVAATTGTGATPEQPAPIDPVVASSAQPGAPGSSPAASAPALTTLAASGRSLNEFQGDDIAQVLRLLARQAKVDLVVSEKIVGTVTMRLENKTPLETIKIICNSKGLIVEQTDGVYYVKTQEEKLKEPTDSAFYTFSYAMVDKAAPLLKTQLQSGADPQMDSRTNTVFFRETKSNLANVMMFLKTIDMPTKQVMIEARLVEVTANPKQSYGVNWGGVFGSSSTPQTIKYGASTPATFGIPATPGGPNVLTAVPAINTQNGSATVAGLSAKWDFRQRVLQRHRGSACHPGRAIHGGDPSLAE